MAQLALAVVGAGIGSLFGAPQLGFMLGSLAGSYLFAPSGNNTEGPRLQDLQATGASYGTPIAFGIGTARLGGNIIWCPGIEEHSDTENQGGKGGGGSSVTTYTYSASFAVAFCEGPKQKALRIWFDGKCVYDTTGTEDVVGLDGMRIEFYPGDETQLPSPVIEAVEGVGNVPAHRGMCYIVFENTPLANFGNRIPTITAEIASSAVRSVPNIQCSGMEDYWKEPTTIPGFMGRMGEVDVERRQLWTAMPDVTLNYAPNTLPSIVVFDADTMVANRQIALSDIFTNYDPGFWVYPGGGFGGAKIIGSFGDNIAIVVSGGLYTSALALVSKDTFKRVGSVSAGNFTNLLAYDYMIAYPVQCVVSPGGDLGDYVFFGSSAFLTEARNYLVSCNGPTPIVYNWLGWRRQRSLNACVVVKHSEFGGSDPTIVQFLSSDVADNLPLYITVGKVKSSQIISDNNSGLVGMRTTMPPPTEYVISREFLGGTPVGIFAFYDEADGNYLICVDVQPVHPSGAQRLIKWNPDVGVIWMKYTPAMGHEAGKSGCLNKQRINGYLYSWISMGGGVNSFIRINTITGDYEIFPSGFPGFNRIGYDAIFNYTSGGNAVGWTRYSPHASSTPPYPNSFFKLFLDRYAPNGEAAIAPFISDMSSRVGLSLSDVNVADITDTVPGYYVVRNTTAKQAIAPLASACQFDAVESDYVMKYFHRGKSAVASLTQADLQKINDEGDVLKERRTQELELPARVVIKYADKDHAYGIGSQGYTRPSFPTRTMQSNGYNTVETPVIMDATRAKRLAETTLYTAWQERISFEYNPDPKFAYLDPTDAIDVALDDGTTYRHRILKLVIGADLNTSFEAVSEDAATYKSTSTGDGGKIPEFPIPQVYPSSLVLFDVPYLQDSDVNPTLPTLYGKVWGYGNKNWQGAVVFKESSSNVYDVQFTETEASTQGQCVNALPPALNPWATDRITKLRVNITSGAEKLSSITYDQLMNYGNAAAVSAPNGEWEIIQYQTVAVIDDSTIELSNLLRGRRGTDAFTDDHSGGDTVLFLRQSEVNKVDYPTVEIGSSRNWKAVSSGQYIEKATSVNYKTKGNSLRPYAPAQVRLTNSGGDTVITWVRRTRYNGELMDGTGAVPLNEASERYSVDIVNSITGVVIRTYDDLLTPTATYTAAHQAADAVANWGAVAYQISATVGRGFPSKMARTRTTVSVAKLTTIALTKVASKALLQAAKLTSTVIYKTEIKTQVQVAKVPQIVLLKGKALEYVAKCTVTVLTK